MSLKNEWLSFRNVIYSKFYMSMKKRRNLIDDFHRLYYDSALTGGTWEKTFWFGIPIRKCPLDCWIYQEILFDVKPDVIIECGTSRGGSALFLAHLCDMIGKGKVITIDIEKREHLPQHPRISYLLGSSTSAEIIDAIKQQLTPDQRVMVIRDSDHHMPHVLNELHLYAPLVTRGSYFIVEDTNLNGHPVNPQFGPGPFEAVQTFLRENQEFEIDKSKEKFLMSFNQNGYLRKK
jgi:cephalosporin hydroxylase